MQLVHVSLVSFPLRVRELLSSLDICWFSLTHRRVDIFFGCTSARCFRWSRVARSRRHRQSGAPPRPAVSPAAVSFFHKCACVHCQEDGDGILRGRVGAADHVPQWVGSSQLQLLYGWQQCWPSNPKQETFSNSLPVKNATNGRRHFAAMKHGIWPRQRFGDVSNGWREMGRRAL